VPDDFEVPLPATVSDHRHVMWPFLHGPRAASAPGDLVLPGRPTHFRLLQPLAHVVVTLDVRHFSVVRPRHVDTFTLLPK
jgi:hypothetical protein